MYSAMPCIDMLGMTMDMTSIENTGVDETRGFHLISYVTNAFRLGIILDLLDAPICYT